MSAVDEIKARIDLVDLIESSVVLKKTGKNYKGLCPFHQEKTPSFVVFPESQRYRCFGCGRGGDIFNWMMDREGMDFPEALRSLAEQAGVTLDDFSPQQQAAYEEDEHLRAVLTEAAGFFHRLLTEHEWGQQALDYVRGRGLSDETVALFQIGYAPDSWDVTSRYLIKEGFSEDDLIKTGMLVSRDDGRTYDRFRDRLIIPIRDDKGRTVGFGARALAKDAKPKYINSPQNHLFDKSKLLFGLSEARRRIRETETAVIVEGYM
ncbi:MAG: DNA primase, partial [Chloroflexi bacterium]|nr:DNA primase [Chloroflexota bacterium]